MKPFLVVLGALVLCAGGCSNGSGGSTDSGGIEGKELVDLTTAERAQFCATNRDTFAALAVGSCVLSGLETAPTMADCEQFRSDCQMPAADGAVCEGGDAGLPDFTGCGTLRVSQVESCLTQAKTFFADLDCSAFGKEPMGAPSCLADVEESCPALLTPFQ